MVRQKVSIALGFEWGIRSRHHRLKNTKMAYPLVICYVAIANGPTEIVDFPMKKMVMFNSYVKLPEGNDLDDLGIPPQHF